MKILQLNLVKKTILFSLIVSTLSCSDRNVTEINDQEEISNKYNNLIIRQIALFHVEPSKDFFIEIYNNGDADIPLAGVSITSLNSNLGTVNDKWSNDLDFIYASRIWTFPEDDTRVLASGERIFIAKSARVVGGILDHYDFTDVDYETVNRTDGGFSGTDEDNPDVNNLVFTAFGEEILEKDMDVSKYHPSIALIQPIEDLNTLEILELSNDTSVTPGYAKISKDLVIDAFENAPTDGVRYLPTSLVINPKITDIKGDKSFYRKEKETINGRIVYQDTDDVTADFYHGDSFKIKSDF